MKVYIMADMEGISGIVDKEQFEDSGRMYNEGRLLYTMEVNAAIEGAVEAGCTEIVVRDGHTNRLNLMMDKVHPQGKYLIGKWNTFEGLDRSVDALVMIGFHAMAGTPNAVWDHTNAWEGWLNLKVNGIDMGEIGAIAAVAGYFDIPLLFISGDAAAVKEAGDLAGGVSYVSVKEGFGRLCALSLSPQEARLRIREGVRQALVHKNASTVKPLKIRMPATVTLEVSNTSTADMMESKGYKRINARTVEKMETDIYKILNF